jgi:hypothetical protein
MLPGVGVRVRRSALTAWLRRLDEGTTAEEQGADGQLRRQALGHQEARQVNATGSGRPAGRPERSKTLVTGSHRERPPTFAKITFRWSCTV